jgi:hypothetical protein
VTVVEGGALGQVGKADRTRTWWRRMPLMWSMCSMSTGHSFTQAPEALGASGRAGAHLGFVDLGSPRAVPQGWPSHKYSIVIITVLIISTCLWTLCGG